MVDLLEKYRAAKERHDALASIGADAVGLVNERVLSPTRAIINGRETILAGTNNYMGVTFEPQCIEAGKRALEEYGTGTTGSRIANGTYSLHAQLEQALAEFMGRRHCMVFSTGFQANLGMIAGLCGPDDTIFIDADSHASIYDGCRLSGAKVVLFRHNDADHLARRLKRHDPGKGGRLVILEGIYSMLGDTAPLRDFVALKQEYDFQLLVDEAHSFGVLGERGRGLAEREGVEDGVDFIVGTFSKSLGGIGGYAVSDHPDFDVLRYTSRPYMFTASPSPASIATTLCALNIIRSQPERRKKLQALSARLHGGLKAQGFRLGVDEVTPVVAVICPDERAAVAMWNGLLQAGVYVNLALPPGTPNKLSLMRCSVSAAHTEEEVDAVIAAFVAVRGQLMEQGLWPEA